MPDEEDEFEEVDPDLLEELDEEPILESVQPGDPDYLVLTGRADPDVDDMLEDAFAHAIEPPSNADDRPTDRPPPLPPPPVVEEDEDEDDAEFRAFMDATYRKP